MLAKNTKNEIKCLEKKESVCEMLKTMRMRHKKRDILLKEIENRRKMAKNETSVNKKRETITRRVKQGDTQKEK